MANERYILPNEGGITIQASAADGLIRAKSGDAALVYICMLRQKRSLTSKEAATVLGTSDTGRAQRALDTLKGLGLINY